MGILLMDSQQHWLLMPLNYSLVVSTFVLHVRHVYSIDDISLMNSAPPNLLLEPSDYALFSFSSTSITLSCKFQGTPLPTVTWTYLPLDGTTPLTLSSGEKYNITNEIVNGGVYFNITTFVTLSTVSREDAGLYTCAAGNGVENLIRTRTNATSQLYFQENCEIMRLSIAYDCFTPLRSCSG